MSKITFRADEDLVERIEDLDASKSEVMREALRRYLDAAGAPVAPERESLDDVLAQRIDALVEERIGARAPPQEVSVTVNIDDERAVSHASDTAQSPDSERNEGTTACGRCGETVAADHVHCPNCGEKRSNRVFCDCGDELRSDWAFCPTCGRRTPAADVLDP
ncbi:ribbon-helix-helix protein, CopG family [Natronorarus salvus]|uniref:ribbon-helix-helix protein, CopG family n=1 Tax=Natronorarus salvus TaxID=3117733 RepID=UPI002F2685FB